MVYRQPSQSFHALQRFILPAVILLLVLLFWWAYVRPFHLPSPAALTQPGIGRSSLSFIPNAGQSDAAVRYLAHSQGMSLFFTDDGLTFSGVDGAVRWRFVGADTAEIQGTNTLPGVANYLYGSDSDKWQTGLPTYGAVTYEGLYPGVEGVFNGRPGQLEATFQLEPGATPNLLQWRFEGVVARLNPATGGLDLVGEDGRLLMLLERPIVRQPVSGGEAPIEADYTLDESGLIALSLAGYEPALPLAVTVPAIPAAQNGYDRGIEVAMDSNYAIYLTGITNSRVFPTVNPVQEGYGGGDIDVFVTKIASDGSTIVYSTYLGGNSNEYGNGIAVDSAGNVIIGGYTVSSNFPLANPLNTNGLGVDAFVSKLSADGSQLLFSTKLGGLNQDEVQDVAVDGQNNFYVIGTTRSNNFPLVNPLQSSHAGGFDDAFVSKISAVNNQLVFSTYLGGNGLDQGLGIDVDAGGNIFLSGSSFSTNFPIVNTTLPQPVGYPSNRQVFATKMAGNGSNLVFSTFVGGADDELGQAIAVDTGGNVVIVGDTRSDDFPVVAPVQNQFEGRVDAFVTKISADGNSFVFSTFLGGDMHDLAWNVDTDPAGNVYLSGTTDSGSFPLLNPLPGNGYPENSDGFVTKLSAAGALQYSTFLGGDSGDNGWGIAVDNLGRAVVVGETDSHNFPLVNPFQSQLLGGTDAFVSRFTPAGGAMEFSTFLGGGSGYPPTDVTISGFGQTAEPNVLPYLIITGLLVLLFIGVWRANRRRFQ